MVNYIYYPSKGHIYRIIVHAVLFNLLASTDSVMKINSECMVSTVLYILTEII